MIDALFILLFIRQLSGIVDGIGSELGGSAMILVLAKWAHEIWKEKKSKTSAERINNDNKQEGNPGRRNNTSTNIMLDILNDHTKQLHGIDEDLKEMGERVAHIEGRLTQKEK